MLPSIVTVLFVHVDRMACMAPGGWVLPGIVTVYGVLVESESLWRDSAVEGNEVTLGLRVADFINDFQVGVAQSDCRHGAAAM